MVNCSFCNKDMVRGTGKLLINRTGKLLYFCSSKCEKNVRKLGRKSQNIKWARKKKEIKK